MVPGRIFLLSPADCGGKRAAMLLRAAADFELARQLRTRQGAALADVFSFLSGLYFRGKITYARRFAGAPRGVPAVLVITSGSGLLAPETRVRIEDLERMAGVPVDAAEPRYREPLLADVGSLAARVPADTRFVLLGSIATPKYVETLLPTLGARLWFPAPFVGVGDMARGALLLRAARSGEELLYLPALSAPRRRAPRIRRAPS